MSGVVRGQRYLQDPVPAPAREHHLPLHHDTRHELRLRDGGWLRLDNCPNCSLGFSKGELYDMALLSPNLIFVFTEGGDWAGEDVGWRGLWQEQGCNIQEKE